MKLEEKRKFIEEQLRRTDLTEEQRSFWVRSARSAGEKPMAVKRSGCRGSLVAIPLLVLLGVVLFSTSPLCQLLGFAGFVVVIAVFLRFD